MNKFLIVFAAFLAVCSAGNVGPKYGYGSSIGAYQLQEQPAVSVQYLVPAYGSYGHNSYGSNGYAPNSLVPSYGKSYGNSYGKPYGVDGQAINLALQGLYAPSAGLPVIADPVIVPSLINTYGPGYSALPVDYAAPAYGYDAPAYGAPESAAAASAAAAASNVSGSKKGASY